MKNVMAAWSKGNAKGIERVREFARKPTNLIILGIGAAAVFSSVGMAAVGSGPGFTDGSLMLVGICKEVHAYKLWVAGAVGLYKGIEGITAYSTGRPGAIQHFGIGLFGALAFAVGPAAMLNILGVTGLTQANC